MPFQLSLRFKQQLTAIMENQLGLIAALLLEASIRHFSFHSQSGLIFTITFLQLVLQSVPLLLAHFVSFQPSQRHAAVIWCSGFIIYPILCFLLAELSLVYAEWTLFEMQAWLFLIIASMGFGLSQLLARRNSSRYTLFVSRLFSLNSVLALLMVVWAVMMAGIFASTDDPLRNQPLETVIRSDIVMVNFGFFIHYVWQFLLMGSLFLLVFWLNRYVLIRRILARSGVFAYAASCLITLIVMTPLLCTVVLWLPLNIPEFTLIPSQDYNVFAPINFQISFFVLAISAPIILAFERQQQDKAIAEIAQRQSQTELQLLQQQVNPHFLFNTLNNLYSLTLTGSQQAPNLVLQLANLLRYTVYEGQQQRVTLSQEIQYLQDFLALQAIRSSDKCQINTAFPEQADKWQIAPLLLIILLENAFKHGVEPSQSPCTISLNITVENGLLLMRCVNSLPDKPISPSPGIGLDNLKRRLALLYAGKHQFVAQRQDTFWSAELIMELEPC
ncbi:sensor histidine kinase [Alishewanella sp. SMS8]|uniref:sensor histidine kinase n=1 Tax=Alishewanella sp. SMS8 TaxID=2994676 RepID=UPI002741D4BA|nr:histidine kinase [Alishewanella sp. SMS8]MDP5458042.1 histidine kinase [Alishewanella sp. SMS8]